MAACEAGSQAGGDGRGVEQRDQPRRRFTSLAVSRPRNASRRRIAKEKAPRTASPIRCRREARRSHVKSSPWTTTTVSSPGVLDAADGSAAAGAILPRRPRNSRRVFPGFFPTATTRPTARSPARRESSAATSARRSRVGNRCKACRLRWPKVFRAIAKMICRCALREKFHRRPRRVPCARGRRKSHAIPARKKTGRPWVRIPQPSAMATRVICDAPFSAPPRGERAVRNSLYKCRTIFGQARGGTGSASVSAGRWKSQWRLTLAKPVPPIRRPPAAAFRVLYTSRRPSDTHGQGRFRIQECDDDCDRRLHHGDRGGVDRVRLGRRARRRADPARPN